MNIRDKIQKLLMAALVLHCYGCATNVEPWQKGLLAKPYMAVEPDPLDRTIREQIVTSKEGASGGYGVVGGGCGCN